MGGVTWKPLAIILSVSHYLIGFQDIFKAELIKGQFPPGGGGSLRVTLSFAIGGPLCNGWHLHMGFWGLKGPGGIHHSPSVCIAASLSRIGQSRVQSHTWRQNSASLGSWMWEEAGFRVHCSFWDFPDLNWQSAFQLPTLDTTSWYSE